MMFVMDTSTSLKNTDPQDFRSAGAIGLVENLSPRSDIKIGVVGFDGNGELTAVQLVGSSGTDELYGLAEADDQVVIAGYTDGDLVGPGEDADGVHRRRFRPVRYEQPFKPVHALRYRCVNGHCRKRRNYVGAAATGER